MKSFYTILKTYIYISVPDAYIHISGYYALIGPNIDKHILVIMKRSRSNINVTLKSFRMEKCTRLPSSNDAPVKI